MSITEVKLLATILRILPISISFFSTRSHHLSFFSRKLTVTHDDIMTSHDFSHFLLFHPHNKLRLPRTLYEHATKGQLQQQYLENPDIKLISNYSPFYYKKKKGTSKTVVINQPYLGFHTNVFRYFQ